MDPRAMEPHGAALWAYFEGDTAAELIVRRDDGQEGRLPASRSFREPGDFTPIESTALARCAGHVLDVGAGSGLHSLALQQRGLRVTAIDVEARSVELMAERGVTDARCADLFDCDAGPFDTLLMLGHGLGMVETLAGLDRFLAHVRGLLTRDGQVLLDSHDVRRTDDAANLAYHAANRRAGRYIGEIRMQLEHRGAAGPWCGWLHVDPGTLAEHAVRGGWTCEVLVGEAGGDYLARLTAERRA